VAEDARVTIVEKELDRFLTLLRNKIRERGFTQLEVQEALGWGRSYISQLLTKQKSLRVEQVLLILDVIGVDPVEFFAELYHFPVGLGRGESYGEYGRPGAGRAPFNPSLVADPLGAADAAGGAPSPPFQELRSLMRGVIRLLVEKGVVTGDELEEMVGGDGGGELP
jgi:transcriptional regulator with XRE-family HTH domain